MGSSQESTGDKNGVGILVDRDLKELVVEVRRVNDRLMSIKLVVGGFTVNVISAYAPQVGLDKEVKKQFLDDLDEMVRSIPHTKKLFIGGDLNGHIGASARGYDDVPGRFDFADRNEERNSLLDFARAFDLVIANSSIPKRESTQSLSRIQWARLRLIIFSAGNAIKVCALTASSSQVSTSRPYISS
ncbi:PREDICTED: craniofacial development protein 2-like [Nicotiana attenuata]|uniref:craniofacial development protein 2-like n=1 Tax=Nicotiana attenuata TaxID=49451 RepID=UPI000905BEB6|nr:PREDICTED: craniofacial development protein 2-like [Nicotiana attenuata]